MSSATGRNDPTRVSAQTSDVVAEALKACKVMMEEALSKQQLAHENAWNEQQLAHDKALNEQKLAHDKEIQSIRKSMTDLEKSQKSLTKEVNDKNALIKQLNKENKKIRDQLKTTQDRIKGLTSPVKNADGSLGEMSRVALLEKLEKKIAALEAERDAANKALAESNRSRETERKKVTGDIRKLRMGLVATSVAVAAVGATAVELVCTAAASKPFLAIIGITLISNPVGAAILSGLAVAAGIFFVGYGLYRLVKFVKSRMAEQIVDQAPITEIPYQAASMMEDPPSVTAKRSLSFN